MLSINDILKEEPKELYRLIVDIHDKLLDDLIKTRKWIRYENERFFFQKKRDFPKLNFDDLGEVLYNGFYYEATRLEKMYHRVQSVLSQINTDIIDNECFEKVGIYKSDIIKMFGHSLSEKDVTDYILNNYL